MSLPEVVAVKLDLYTLACCELLERLHDLHAATQADSRQDCETCLQLFDGVLHEFFECSSATDRDQAAKQLGGNLHARVGYFRDSNENAAAIFDDVVTAMHSKVSNWHYQTDLEQFHLQGRELARRFFADSPWPETQERLGRECHLVIEYGAPADDDRIAMLTEPFGYGAAPMAYYPSYWDGEQAQSRTDVLLARFTFKHDFALYLAHPFLFLHEYTAHIYATDYGNECFNDGWMLHAAAAFLKQEWNEPSQQPGLNWAQAGVFYQHLLGRINKVPRRAYWFTWRFDDWLDAMHLPERFMEITYELAAFQPQSGEGIYWPMQFINALEREFMTDRKRLLEKIKASAGIRELMTMLSSI
jgi:hypothetical protein